MMHICLFCYHLEKEALLLAQSTNEKLVLATEQERESTQILAEQISTLQVSLQQQTRKCTEKDEEIKGLRYQLTTNDEHFKFRNDELLKELRQTRGQLGTIKFLSNLLLLL